MARSLRKVLCARGHLFFVLLMLIQRIFLNSLSYFCMSSSTLQLSGPSVSFSDLILVRGGSMLLLGNIPQLLVRTYSPGYSR